MKMTWFKKTVLFLHWLISLLLVVMAVCLCVCPDVVQEGINVVNSTIGAIYGEIVGIALFGIYALLAVTSVAFIFSNAQKRSERGFITVDSSESGRTRIAIGAVDQMIRQAVRSVEGVVDMKSNIVNCEDAISINANVVIANGAHVPTVTMNMQRAVRSYIELNCGVAVREVCVNVSALESDEENGKHGRRKMTERSHQIAQAPSGDVPVIDTTQKEVQVASQDITQADNAETMQDGKEEPVIEDSVE